MAVAGWVPRGSELDTPVVFAQQGAGPGKHGAVWEGAGGAAGQYKVQVFAVCGGHSARNLSGSKPRVEVRAGWAPHWGGLHGPQLGTPAEMLGSHHGGKEQI